MNWYDEREAIRRATRPDSAGGRLVRGLLWALLAVFVISALVFATGPCGGEPITSPL